MSKVYGYQYIYNVFAHIHTQRRMTRKMMKKRLSLALNLLSLTEV